MASSGKLKQLIGKTTKPVVYEIERGQIRRFAAAVGEDNPVHFDDKAAKGAGADGLLASPTFPAALLHLGELYAAIGIDERNTMHAEEEYELTQPIAAGDEIQVVHKVVDAYDKQAPNGRLIFIIVESRGTDARKKPVFKSRRVLVELKS